MADRGRPNLPQEVKKRRGTYQPVRDRTRADAVELAPTSIVPNPPDDLGERGCQVWRRLFTSGAGWINPEVDWEAVHLAAMLADMAEIAQGHYERTGDYRDASAILGFLKQFQTALAHLGFDPSSRAKLGVAEIKRQSALEKMLQERRDNA